MPFVRTSARATARHISRRPGRALVLLSATLLAAACTTSGTSGGGQSLTVAVVPGIDTAPLSIAVKDGLFTQQDVSVTVKQVASSQDAYHDLLNGSVNVAAGDYAGFFYGIAGGRQLKLVADGYDAGPGTLQILTLPDSGITTPQGLVGKIVGTADSQVAPYQNNFPYNIQTLAAESVLQSDGVPPATVTWDELAPNNMISALRYHQVDAILVTEPQLTEAEEQLGAVELIDACSGITANLPLTGYFSTSSEAGQEAGPLAAFQTALQNAEGDASDRSVVESALTGQDISTEDAALVNVGQYPTFLNVGQVQRVADLMYSSGMITSPVSVAGIKFSK